MSSYKTVVKEIGTATGTDPALKDALASLSSEPELISKTSNTVANDELLGGGGGGGGSSYLEELDTSFAREAEAKVAEEPVEVVEEPVEVTRSAESSTELARTAEIEKATVVDPKTTEVTKSTATTDTFASDGGLGTTRDPELAKSGNQAVDDYLEVATRSTDLSTTEKFASDGGLGTTRDPSVATSGNYAVDEFLKEAERVDAKTTDTTVDKFASDGGLGTTRDPTIAKSGNYAVDEFLKQAELSKTDTFASDGGLGTTRDPTIAKSGNYAVDEFLRQAELSRTDTFASDGGLGTTRDPTIAKSGNYAVDEFLKQAELSKTDTFASDGGLGTTRDPELAKSGNIAVDEFLAKSATTDARVDSFASDGGLGTTRDPELVDAVEEATVLGTSIKDMTPEELEATLRIIEASHQASVSTLADLPPDLLESLPAETILRLAYSPEDMATLDLNLEHQLIGMESNLLSVNNPDMELANYLIDTKMFQDVIISGHGNEEGIFITDDDGKAQLLTSDEVAQLMCDAGVEEILLNVCDGGATLDDALNAVGISTFAHDRDIYDAEAIEDARVFAEAGTLAAISTEEDIYGGKAVYNDVSTKSAAIPETDAVATPASEPLKTEAAVEAELATPEEVAPEKVGEEPAVEARSADAGGMVLAEASPDIEAALDVEERELTRSERRELRQAERQARIAERQAEREANKAARQEARAAERAKIQAQRAENKAARRAARKAGRKS